MLFAGSVITAAAQTVTDGDTIKLDGVSYRIWGIDAAENKQLCPDGWPAGRAATTHMRELVHGRTVVCEFKTKDRYGRIVALCRANGEDIGAAMVRAGHAWAFVRYSRDYVDQEARARAERLSVHAHGCQPAWVWRAEQRAPASRP
ncbi:COG1525 Micrococcal nuclease (thermonuclease) homologs [uncultured Caudovirales phage]|uniref:COG1525 Micrococcal nuclease (Thermonuclease) homologs n=1 Tax=uncultured Caudovirales phage TaxID=2100421 RepID=A0A6J5RFZ8_9CAUD|nr:COG1525 Micrococcal nuclease (thermonuclease) homologs [uncultured Caudovirales phage]CAB4195929.1 COG1525 Micrococcal nuclease (thermonuclease) homologs [uncultured Caudovirales phage]CAB4222622.1 COG1525 Micrococcal nuclease (thermonuclease) homologs [uncultured Caudovirales phage]